jgi:hypothetical protein
MKHVLPMFCSPITPGTTLGPAGRANIPSSSFPAPSGKGEDSRVGGEYGRGIGSVACEDDMAIGASWPEGFVLMVGDDSDVILKVAGEIFFPSLTNILRLH